MARFIDEAKISLKAGHGGRGCVSFRREKFVPRGGPDGGDGGKGGDIIIVADPRLTSLLDFRYKREYTAENGAHGMGNNRHGRNGKDLILHVPVGTVIKAIHSDRIAADLVKEAEEVRLLRGGRGGKGNAHFKTSTHRAPRFAQPGEEGEYGEFKLELKLLAEVGIIGLPNAGKSTLISLISAARPKVAGYPFTTIVPHLGIVRFKGDESFVVADVPGLVSGAHAGKGLGTRFLKHIERTKLLIHLVDVSPQSGRDPLKDYEDIKRELYAFNPELLERPQIVALNKIDMAEDSGRLSNLMEYFKLKGVKAFPISCLAGEGLDELVNSVGEMAIRARKETGTPV